MSMQISDAGPETDWTKYVEELCMLYFPPGSQGLVYKGQSSCQDRTSGSLGVWVDDLATENDSLYNSAIRQQTVPWMHNSLLWSCHLGRGWVMGVKHPIYMLNCIIGPQTVVKIVTTETPKALNLPSKQQTKLYTAICQSYWPQIICLFLREEVLENLT